MSLLALFPIAIGLSMDAFAAAICTGLSMQERSFKNALIIGLYFGIFQAIMPLIGYFLGSQLSAKISEFGHWIAFILLAVIGGKMIKEAFQKEDEEPKKKHENAICPKKMLPLALATSIDALAVGISFAFLNVRIIPAVTLIGFVTLILSILGTSIGNSFGKKFKQKAELAGGLILILIGIKIFFEHIEILIL